MKLKKQFEFIDITARMALRADASRMWLGYLWWVLEPLLFVAIFYLVFGIMLQSGGADFLTFLIVGKLPFQWFSGGLNSASGSIVGARGLIAQSAIPKTLFVMSKVQESTYREIGVFALMIAYLFLNNIFVTAAWIWLPLIVLCQYALLVCCGLIGAIMVCFARDFSKIIQLFTLLMMFASGVFWDVRALPEETQSYVLSLNPLALLLDAYRQVFLHQAAPDVIKLVTVLIVFTLIGGLVATWIRKNEALLAMRALS